jgi:hypothetical protein
MGAPPPGERPASPGLAWALAADGRLVADRQPPIFSCQPVE